MNESGLFSPRINLTPIGNQANQFEVSLLPETDLCFQPVRLDLGFRSATRPSGPLCFRVSPRINPPQSRSGGE